MAVILVTGASGQLGNEIKFLQKIILVMNIFLLTSIHLILQMVKK